MPATRHLHAALAAVALALPAGANAEEATGFAAAWASDSQPADPTATPADEAPAPDIATALRSRRALATRPVLGNPLYGAAARALAAPFVAPLAAAGDRALDCLTMAIAYEAGNQPMAGQQAVGQVILNRVRTGRFQRSVCGVVFAGSQRSTGCQFTFTCDGSLNRQLRDTTWESARMAAASVLAGAAPDRVGGATHYHADYVLPYWASTGQVAAKIGAHIFYRMPGDAPGTQPAAFADGAEPDFIPLPRLRARRGQVAMATPPMAARPVFAPWGLPVAGSR